MKHDCVVVWTTVGPSADCRGMATILVNERLAACVNVLSEMESIYRWKGQIEADRERQLIMKTTSDRVPALRAPTANNSESPGRNGATTRPVSANTMANRMP